MDLSRWNEKCKLHCINAPTNKYFSRKKRESLMKYGCRLLSLVCSAFLALSFSTANASQFGDIDLYQLGKKVYGTGAESCRTCHGADGAGTTRSKVNLGDPTTWKAFEYETALKNTGLVMNSDAVAQAVISLGGRGWNEQNFSRLRAHLTHPDREDGATPKPFDENMVGLSGSNKKLLITHVRRLLRKSGLPKASPKEIEDLLSASALTYIKQEFMK